MDNQQQNYKIIPADEIFNFAKDCFLQAGFNDTDASLIAENMKEADLRGLSTHGVLRIPMYLERVKKGVLDQKAKPELAVETDSFSIWDAKNGMGVIASVKAMDMAISKAKEKGLYLSGVRNSNHFGAAAFYTMRASQQKMIGFCCSNTEPLMPAPSGAEKIVGNNPFSIAFPGGKNPDIVVDMAVSSVAIGKIVLADKKGISIPNGWATDSNGKETNDPKEALDGGFLLPVGGPKGYGLSIAIDILSGIIMSSGFGAHVRCPFHDFSGSQNLGHMFLALNIEKFLSISQYTENIEELIDRIKNSKRAPDTNEIFLPGEIEYKNKIKNSKNGISLPQDLINELHLYANELGVKENLFDKYYTA